MVRCRQRKLLRRLRVGSEDCRLSAPATFEKRIDVGRVHKLSIGYPSYSRPRNGSARWPAEAGSARARGSTGSGKAHPIVHRSPPCLAHTLHILCILCTLLGAPSMQSMCRVCGATGRSHFCRPPSPRARKDVRRETAREPSEPQTHTGLREKDVFNRIHPYSAVGAVAPDCRDTSLPRANTIR
jgi:hypothetical protein